MNLQKINDIAIKPVLDNGALKDPKKIVGYDYFPEPYCNTFICGRKMSGKTVVLYRAMEHCVQKGTNVMIFASSVNNDKTYSKMKKMLKDKKCNVKTYTHFIDDNGVDLIDQFIKLKSSEYDDTGVKPGEKKEEDKSISELLRGYADFGQHDNILKSKHVDGHKEDLKKKKKKENKNKKICPETIMIFDDLADLLRHPSLARLLVRNRHFLLKTFVIGHSIINLSPMALRMIDCFMLFPNLSEERIFEVADKVGISFRSDTKKTKKLYDLYCHATQKPYNFLYCDRNNCTYRKNFSEIYNITSDE
jgi:hypothetical protein